MGKSKLYEGKLCGYCEVEKLKDEKLLDVCNKAAEVIILHDWHDMQHDEIYNGPYAIFKVEGTDFEDCKVIVRNIKGMINARVVGKISKKTPYSDFRIDLYSHPRIGEEILNKYHDDYNNKELK